MVWSHATNSLVAGCVHCGTPIDRREPFDIARSIEQMSIEHAGSAIGDGFARLLAAVEHP